LRTKKNIDYVQEFFDSMEKSEEVSQINKNIIKRYINSIVDERPKKSPGTVLYNVKIMKFVLQYVKTDLDKLTIDDIDDFKTTLSNWKRKDGRSIADSTINQYKVGFKKFLYYYAERYDNTIYTKLAKQIKTSSNVTTKPNDILTKEEIGKMIDTAVLLRDKAVIATFFESGCRIGEIFQCTVKDFEPLSNGCKLTFPAGKTGKRTVTLVYAASYIDNWLTREHCRNTDPNAPLWLTMDGKEPRGLAYDSIYGIVKRIAKQSGINKSIHPHTYRHTRATQLAKIWTEPQMKKYLGWSPKSNMPATYIHLNDNDMEEAVLEMNGLIEIKKQDKGLEVGKCRKCLKLNPTTAIFCYNCGLPLSDEAEKSADFALQKLMQLQMMCPSTDLPELFEKLAKIMKNM
jgi:integrase/recombinase XerD